MMSKYIPCLKTKTNELNAFSWIPLDVRAGVCPLFDVHRGDHMDATAFPVYVAKLQRSFAKHLKGLAEFYCDNYDVGDDLLIGGDCNYKYLLSQLTAQPVVPVVGIDRKPVHNSAVLDLKTAGQIESSTVAFRVTPEEFESFGAVEDDIDDELSAVFQQFETVDLILDCRMCRNANAVGVAGTIVDFVRGFIVKYATRRVVVTGSSIPATISDLVKVDHEYTLVRTEIEICGNVSKSLSDVNLCFGDYATVSPYYSDVKIPMYAMQNVMTAKFTYSHDDKHYFIRGGSLKVKGRGQYRTLAQILCAKPFFRGQGYSLGDNYFHEKSLGQGADGAPNSVLKPSIVSHISFVVRNSPI
tara:strand:+ start:1739 stop:2806 length:1068 start_codon:yes stop_codon:yes gene_type:complete